LAPLIFASSAKQQTMFDSDQSFRGAPHMATFKAGQFELQSTRWLAGHAGDRPSFQADIHRGLFSSGHFQVFAMPQGLLCLELRFKDQGGFANNGPSAGAIACMQFGAIGGLAAGLQMARDAQRYGTAAPDRYETGMEMRSDEELFELARSRRKSFVSKYDEIRLASIDAPGFLGRALGDSKLAGCITLRDRSLGKVKLEIRDQSALSVAVDALPRRLGDRLRTNVEFDRQSMRFVPKRG
jgi:hypothetical protein